MAICLCERCVPMQTERGICWERDAAQNVGQAQSKRHAKFRKKSYRRYPKGGKKVARVKATNERPHTGQKPSLKSELSVKGHVANTARRNSTTSNYSSAFGNHPPWNCIPSSSSTIITCVSATIGLCSQFFRALWHLPKCRLLPRLDTASSG